MITLCSIKGIAYQESDSLLAGGESVKVDALLSILNLTLSYSQSDKLSSDHSANILAQYSAKSFAQQSAKTLADVSAKIYANQSILTTNGGWDLMCVRLTYGVQHSNLVNNVHSVQPLGLMPLDCSSLRAKSLNQLPKLIPSSLANSDNCSLNSGWMRIWKAGALPSPFGLLSLFIVDMCVPIEIVSNTLGTHLNMEKPNKTMPRSALTLTGHLTTTDRLSIEEAMKDHITPVTGRNSFTPNIKFKWRFFSCQQSKYFSVEASNEKEARSLLPDSPCLFSARIRQEGDHA